MPSSRALCTLLGAALLASLWPRPTHAALTVVTADELEKNAVFELDGHLYLQWGDRRWELAADVDSPSISNPGDGSFHPFDRRLVQDAIDALPDRVARLNGTILILPFPRADAVKSCHEAGVVFLSPGVRDVHPSHVHATVTHEIGHLVQYRLVPESSAAWSEYVRRRGLSDPRFDDQSQHRDRPREIFAEDFRLLFGSELARAGSQENGDLPTAASSPDVSTWFDDLVVGSAADRSPTAPIVYPNPARARATPWVTIRFAASAESPSATADVFDVRGRRVATLDGHAAGEWAEFRWVPGERVGAGVYFVRARASASPSARVLWGP